MHQCKKCGKNLTVAEAGSPCPQCGGMDRSVSGADSFRVAEAAAILAGIHYEIEPGLTHIFHIRVEDPAAAAEGAPIRLLEVNANTPEAGILPLRFGPAPASGVPYASVIVQVSPDEYEKLRSHELKLPDGWEIGEEIARPPAVGTP